MVTHTLNLRLHPDDLTYIATHAGDRVLIADKILWPLVENFRERVGFEHVIAIGAGDTPDGAIDFEELLATQDPDGWEFPDVDERAAAAMCYTSGTTGPPKGVAYSHRAIAIHTLAQLLGNALPLDGLRRRAAGRADVPRERLGLPVRVHDGRREAGLPRAAPRPGEPARRVSGAKGDVDSGCPDDLARDPRDARRRPRRVRPVGAEGDGRRWRGSATVDDRGFRDAATA